MIKKIILFYVAWVMSFSANASIVSSAAEALETFKTLQESFLCHSDEREQNKVYFNSVYILVTEGLIDIVEKTKDTCVEEMIIEFANMYLSALDSSRKAPLVWQEMFDLEGTPTTYLLLGMNAHISYDLPISLFKVSTRNASCSPEKIKEMYFSLNDFFEELTPQLNQEIKRIHEIKLNHAQMISLPDSLEERAVIELVIGLRRAAWKSYLRLWEAKSGEAFFKEKQKIENKAILQSQFFKTLRGVLPEVGY